MLTNLFFTDNGKVLQVSKKSQKANLIWIKGFKNEFKKLFIKIMFHIETKWLIKFVALYFTLIDIIVCKIITN